MASAFKTKAKHSYISWALLLLLIAGISNQWLGDFAVFLPKNFHYSSNLYSKDNFFNPETQRFKGEILSKSTFNIQSVQANSKRVVLKHNFEVKTPEGRSIISIERRYGVNRKTGAHTEGGDRERNGFLFGPHPSTTDGFVYWHVNFDSPINMQFVKSTLIEGLEVYHYHGQFKVDQSKELAHLEGVNQDQGIIVEGDLDLFIEPLSGYLVNYKDRASAWFYDLHSGEKIRYWNKFSNTFTYGSLHHHVERARWLASLHQSFTTYLPVALIVASVLVLFLGLALSSVSLQKNEFRPKLLASLVAGIGLSISAGLFWFLGQSDQTRKMQGIESLANQIWTEVKAQLDQNTQALDYLSYLHQEQGGISKELFHSLASHHMDKNPGLSAMGWIEKVHPIQKATFERKKLMGQSIRAIDSKTSDSGFLYPITYVEPYIGNEHAIGFDFGTSVERRWALLNAMKFGEPRMTPILQLVQDFNETPSTIVFSPVYNANKEFLGGFTGVYRLPDLIQRAIAYLNFPEEVEFELRESEKPDQAFFSSADAWFQNGVHFDYPLELMGQKWTLSMLASEEYLHSHHPANYLVLIIGLILTGITSLLVYREENDNREEILKVNAELLESKEQLEMRSEKLKTSNRELEQFAYIASHDLQEPLRSISIISEMLEDELSYNDSPEVKKWLGKLNQGTQRMHHLIQDLLKYAKLGRTQDFQQVDLNAICQEVVEDLRGLMSDRNAELHLEALPKIFGYRHELKQLFQNLVVNAIKFCPKDRIPSVSIGSYESEKQWVFFVKDNGMGIPEKHRDRIFTIFQRLHSKEKVTGTGIGLAICKKVVDLHGGEIWLKSVEDHGSTFFFSVPK